MKQTNISGHLSVSKTSLQASDHWYSKQRWKSHYAWRTLLPETLVDQNGSYIQSSFQQAYLVKDSWRWNHFWQLISMTIQHCRVVVQAIFWLDELQTNSNHLNNDSAPLRIQVRGSYVKINNKTRATISEDNMNTIWYLQQTLKQPYMLPNTMQISIVSHTHSNLLVESSTFSPQVRDDMSVRLYRSYPFSLTYVHVN